MFDERLYVMALYATRLLGGPAGAGEHEVSLRAALAVASTEDEAREKGGARLLDWCPPGEGWENHRVSLSHVPRAALLRILDAISGEDDAPDWPEKIM